MKPKREVSAETREKIRAGLLKYYKDPANRAKNSESTKKRPPVSLATKEKLHAIQGDPTHRARQSENQRRVWQRQEYRTEFRRAYKAKFGYSLDPLAEQFGDRAGVYIIYTPSVIPVKIGSSAGMAGRLKVFQTGSLVPIQFAAICECPIGFGARPIGVEAAMKRAFLSRRLWGEVYNVPVAEAVTALTEMADAQRLSLLVAEDFLL